MHEPQTPAVLKVGLAGWGLAGRTLHAPFIRATPALQLASVVTTRTIDGALYPFARRVESFEALLQDPSLDLVVVATPNALHVEQVLAALAAGKHVVCDKPLARTAAEVRALAAAASAAGKLLLPFQNRRWDSDHRTVQALVSSGKLGRVHAYESRWSRYQPEPKVRAAWKAEPAFNGPLFDLFPHLLDQAIALFGRPARVAARLRTNRPASTTHDFARLVLDYDGGPEVVLEADMLDAFSGRQTSVRGGLGCFETHGLDPQEARLVAGELPGDAAFGRPSEEQTGRLRAGPGPHDEAVQLLPGDHGLFYRGVAAALLQGAPPPVPLGDVSTQVEIIEAALRASESGQIVRLT